MDLKGILTLSAILIALAAGGVLLSAVRLRRHRQRLIVMGRRHSMALLDGDPSAAAVSQARRFGGREHRVRLKNVLVGEDDEGRFCFAQRTIDRRRHHVLFTVSGAETHVEGFHVLPKPALKGKSSRWSLRRRGCQPGTDWQLDLSWISSRSAWLDGHALGVAARVPGQIVRSSAEPGAIPMGIEIHRKQILIHSAHPLRGDDLDRFVDSAIKLRRQIQQAIQSVESKIGEKPSGAVSRARSSHEMPRVQLRH